MNLLSDLDSFASDLLRKAKAVNSTAMAEEIGIQLDVFNSVARFLAIKNKINPDETKEGSIINGYKKEIKRDHTGRGEGGNADSGSYTASGRKRRARPAPYERGAPIKIGTAKDDYGSNAVNGENPVN